MGWKLIHQKLYSMMRMLLLVLVMNCLVACVGSGAKTLQEQESMQPKGLERTEISSQNVKDALGRVPRRYFVPQEYQDQAQEDKALAIGFGQTISQPFIVALMSQYAEVQKGSRVLEIGTGSGYQAAVLSELGADVYTVEIIPELSERARRTLYALGYEDVRLKVGDGAAGWSEHAPYDAIIVTAASPSIPEKLIEQLSPRGRMLIPVEEEGEKNEQLLLISRNGDSLTTKRLGAVRFVPLEGMIREAKGARVNYTEPHLLQEALKGGLDIESGGSSNQTSVKSENKKP